MLLYNFYTFFASEKEKKQTTEEPSKETNNHFGRFYFDALNNESFRELSPLALKVYVSMFEYADWKTGKCWPSQTQLARNCGCKRETVNRKIKELEEREYIRKKDESKRPVYYIIAYEKHNVAEKSQGVTPRSQGVTPRSQGGVTPRSHELESSNENIKNNKQQNNTTTVGLSYEDVISTTSSAEPETIKSVCCNISNIFFRKFHIELPYRFVKEKIKSGEVFDDQFYIKIIQTQQRMPDNPIGWWRSIDLTWVIDENARPVDRVGRGWRIYKSTVEVEKEDGDDDEDEEILRAKAEREEAILQIKAEMDEIMDKVEERRQALSEDGLEVYKSKAHEFLDDEEFPKNFRLQPIIDGAINTLLRRELGLDEKYSKLKNKLKELSFES